MRIDELLPTEKAKRIAAPARPFECPGLLVDGEIVDQTFEIVRRIGSGGMAEVYEAIDVRLARRVAIKVAPSATAEPLVREGRLLASLRHEGILRVHHTGIHEGLVYLVMDLLGGASLQQHLDRPGAAWTVPDCLVFLEELSATLEYLHEQGLAHRDLKPDNVMVLPGGRVVLFDFGITVLERHAADAKSASGSPHYMAPESFTASVNPGEAHLVDLYALGVMAFRILSGHLPFEDGSPLHIAQQHLDARPPRVSAYRDKVPPRLDHLVAALLAKQPGERPASISVVRAQLRAVRRSLDEERAAAPPRSVLLVDDDPSMCELLRACVRQAAPDATIEAVANGPDALARASDTAYDMIFLDLDLPGINGIEVFLQLSANPDPSAPRVVVVTAHDEPENRSLLRQLGVHGFVSKRDGMLELEDGVTDLMARDRRIKRR